MGKDLTKKKQIEKEVVELFCFQKIRYEFVSAFCSASIVCSIQSKNIEKAKTMVHWKRRQIWKSRCKWRISFLKENVLSPDKTKQRRLLSGDENNFVPRVINIQLYWIYNWERKKKNLLKSAISLSITIPPTNVRANKNGIS